MMMRMMRMMKQTKFASAWAGCVGGPGHPHQGRVPIVSNGLVFFFNPIF